MRGSYSELSRQGPAEKFKNVETAGETSSAALLIGVEKLGLISAG